MVMRSVHEKNKGMGMIGTASGYDGGQEARFLGKENSANADNPARIRRLCHSY